LPDVGEKKKGTVERSGDVRKCSPTPDSLRAIRRRRGVDARYERASCTTKGSKENDLGRKKREGELYP